MPVSTVSVALDMNVPIVEEHPDGLKATPYFEDYLFNLLRDIRGINVLAGDAYGVVNGDTGSATADAPSTPISVLGIEGITTVAADGAPDTLTISDDPSVAYFLGE